LIALLLSIGITAVAATLPLYQSPPEDVLPATSESVPLAKAPSPRDMEARVEETVRAYFAAASIEAKLPFVRRPAAVRPLMERYYRLDEGEGKVPPLALGDVHIVATQDAIQREHPLILASAETKRQRLIPLLLEVRNGHYLIDWESQVGYSPQPLEEFLRSPVGTRQWFRLHARRSDYHNHHFDEPAATLSLRLEFPGSDVVAYGYLSRTHPQFGQGAHLLASQSSVPMMVTLTRTPTLAGHPPQFEIARIRQHGWFVEDASPTYAEAWAGTRSR
jgi:hypothetical protein